VTREPDHRSTEETVAKANRDMVRALVIFGGLVTLALAGVLVWVVLYVHSGHGVSCQTNSIVRGLHNAVDVLLHAVTFHEKHVNLPKLLGVPAGCK
jgi:hypothetical protein